MPKSSTERPTDEAAPGTYVADTGMAEQDLKREDEASAQARPDTPQETTGGAEPRESRPTRIHYRGLGTIRRITAHEWADAGVTGQETVEWNRLNKYSLSTEHLTDDALNLIRNESEFSLE